MKTGGLFVLLILGYILSAHSENRLQMVGSARLNILFWSVYDIELFSADGYYAPNSLPVALKITYLRDFTSLSLVERAGEEWQKQGINHPATNQWLSALLTIWPDIKQGDSLKFSVDCSGAGRFYYNERLIGVMEDKVFSNHFLAIWLSKKTSQPGMRSKLLGDRLMSRTDNALCFNG